MQKTFHLTIARVDAPVFEGTALSVTLPGKEGDMTILPRHVAIMTPLRPGTVTVRTTEGTRTFDAEGGICEMSGTILTILFS